MNDAFRIWRRRRRIAGGIYLPEGLLLLLSLTLTLLRSGSLGIAVGRDVLLERGVLVCDGRHVSIIRVESSDVDVTYRGPRCCQVPETICGSVICLAVSMELAGTAHHNTTRRLHCTLNPTP